ncbi:hypothetical protein BJH93_07560 [Kocuria polaris]|nr:hypothetical protein [Kocuria polaris]
MTSAAMPRKALFAALVFAGLGLLIVAVFLVVSGVEYSMTESQGLDPGPTPDWILSGMHLGFSMFVVAALVAAIWGVTTDITHRKLIKATNTQ